MKYPWFKTKTGLVVVQGDLIAAFLADEVNAVAHGINPHVMGSGFAELLREAVQRKHNADLVRATYNANLRPSEFDVVATPFYHDVVFNMVTQPRPGPFASISGVETCLKKVAVNEYTSAVSIPFVGAGIGGLPLAAAFNAIHRSADTFRENYSVLTLWLHEEAAFNRVREYATTEGLTE